MNSYNTQTLRYSITDTHIRERDITQKYSVRDLEDIDDSKVVEIRKWIKFQKDKLRADKAAWYARGGRYKAPEELFWSDSQGPWEPCVKGY